MATCPRQFKVSVGAAERKCGSRPPPDPQGSRAHGPKCDRWIWLQVGAKQASKKAKAEAASAAKSGKGKSNDHQGVAPPKKASRQRMEIVPWGWEAEAKSKRKKKVAEKQQVGGELPPNSRIDSRSHLLHRTPIPCDHACCAAGRRRAEAAEGDGLPGAGARRRQAATQAGGERHLHDQHSSQGRYRGSSRGRPQEVAA